MPQELDQVDSGVEPGSGDCWNRIGVAGDVSCPELETAVHCRNCDVFIAAGRAFLDRPQPDGYAEEWHAALSDAHEGEAASSDTVTALLFRIAGEWFALEARYFREIIEERPIHRLPHRSDDVLLGLANVRGQQQLCVSLSGFLGLEEHPHHSVTHIVYPRMLVMDINGEAWVAPVDEVFGLHTFSLLDLGEIPVTVAGTTASFTRGLLDWQETKVALLDADHLFGTLRRHVL